MKEITRNGGGGGGGRGVTDREEREWGERWGWGVGGITPSLWETESCSWLPVYRAGQYSGW